MVNASIFQSIFLNAYYGLGWSTRPGVLLYIGSYHTGNPGEHGVCIGENVRAKGLVSGKSPGKKVLEFWQTPCMVLVFFLRPYELCDTFWYRENVHCDFLKIEGSKGK